MTTSARTASSTTPEGPGVSAGGAPTHLGPRVASAGETAGPRPPGAQDGSREGVLGPLAVAWRAAGGEEADLEAVDVVGPAAALPSAFAVTDLATASVAAASLAVAELGARRTGRAIAAVVADRARAAVAFRSERYLQPIGWDLPAVWDPMAGDYATADGWIRLHTNYAHHRAAAADVLGVGGGDDAGVREAVVAAVAGWSGDELEAAVVGAGGCAARQRTAAEWSAHPQARAVAAEPVVARSVRPGRPSTRWSAGAGDRPLAGVRVLDLTRVIAGPVCTRVLAAFGADVLRLDPPGFEEVGALLPETTVGKRRAALDLGGDGHRAAFEALVAGADVVVHGYRADALDRLGFGDDVLTAIRPGLVVTALDAYGWTGPWANRRGFDSLVQMSVGITDAGQRAAGADRPVPLPAQALDHATGYLAAAATCRALTDLLDGRGAATSRLSLAATAALLTGLGPRDHLAVPEPAEADVDRWRSEVPSAFGPVRQVACPGSIAGVEPRWDRPAGPLGVDPAQWTG